MGIRRRRQRVRVDYTPMRRAQLLHGHDLFHGAYGCMSHCGEDLDWELIKEHWAEHKVELIHYWSQPKAAWLAAGEFGMAHPEPGGPFTRPFAWWALEAPHRILEAINADVVGVYKLPRLPIKAELTAHGLLLDSEKKGD